MDLLKIDGIYDNLTYETLKNKGCRHFGFDLRPRSFNFIQHYKMMEFLSKGIEQEYIYLHFSNEVDFIIKKFIFDLNDMGIKKDHIILEFSDLNKVEFYDQFERSYYYHFNFDREGKDFDQAKYFKGFILNAQTILKFIEQNQFFEKVAPLLKIKDAKSNPIRFILKCNWGEGVDERVLEFLQVFLLSHSIGPEIELSYRKVDFPKMNQMIDKNRQDQTL